MDRVEFVAPDATIEDLETSLGRVELPAGLAVDQRNREREVVRAQDQRGLLVALRLDRMFRVIHGHEALAYLGVGDIVAGGDDVLGGLAEHLQNGARAALDRGRKRRGCLLRCRIGCCAWDAALSSASAMSAATAAEQGRT